MSAPASPPVTGVIVAMPSELRHLLEAIPPGREEHAGPWIDRHLTYAGHRLVVVCSGIGMVNAAAATEHLIATQRPVRMLNVGCAGAHRRDILPGDVIIGTETVSHGAVHILPTGEDYFPRVETPEPGDVVRQIPLDPDLLTVARAAARDWSPAPWPLPATLPPGIEARAPRVFSGVVASADIWTQEHARLDRLHAAHRSLCEDMEAAAVAQICLRHRVPFLTIKDISNNEYHGAAPLTGGETELLPWNQVGQRSAALLLRLLDRLPA